MGVKSDLELGMKLAEEAGKIARATKVKPTVKEAERIAYPGIYGDPREIAKKAASRVAPESPAMKQLFGVTREDLYDIGKERKGNLPGILPGAAENPKGSKAAEKIMTKKNEQRLLDAFAESEKYPELIRGMDPWYVMDPLYKHMVQLVGPKRAAEEYKKFNTLLGMASPGSEVTTEIPRGTAAYFLQKEGRFPEFEEFAGMPAAKRKEIDFPQDIMNVPGHMYHKTAHSTPMAKFLETGELNMDSPKVPMYIEASGVPETGFQTATPVGDAHWSRAVGLGDTRTAKNFGASVSTPEMSMLAPWWRKKIAGEVGIESVPAQARAWGLFSPQTGVTTPIGKPKLEMIADKIMETADRLKISPEDARDMVLTGKTYAGKKEGGEITFADGGSSHKQGKPLDISRGPRSTKSDSELLDQYRQDELKAEDYLKVAPKIPGIAGRMLKEQWQKEYPTYKDPRAIPDIALNALASGVGSISDIAHIGTGVDRPVLGSEHLQDLLHEYGLTTGKHRPLAENAAMILSPRAIRSAESGLNALRPAVERAFTPITTTVEAVAPDLAFKAPRDWQEYVTNRMISGDYRGVPMDIMGDRITTKTPGQGVYKNLFGHLETNPLVAVDVPNVYDVSKSKDLLADVASAGKALNQESMAGIRFLPLATNKAKDASAMLVKPREGKISAEDIVKIGKHLGDDMIVSHNPRLGGVVIAPFDKPQGELEIAHGKIKDLFGSDMNVKYGHSDLQKDRFYMPKETYESMGARPVPQRTLDLRKELKEMENRRFASDFEPPIE